MALSHDLQLELTRLIGTKTPTTVTVAEPSGLALQVYFTAVDSMSCSFGEIQLFVPSLQNAAFDALPEGALEDLLRPENKQTLYNVVTSHASPGKFTLELLKDGMQLYQATGHYVDVEVKDDGTYVNGAKILATVPATNGVVHVVDQVFLLALN